MRLKKVPYFITRSIVKQRLVIDNFSFKNKLFKKTSDRDDKVFVWHTLANPKDTFFALATPLKSGYKFSRNTVRKILKAYGKAKRKPCQKLYLKPEYK